METVSNPADNSAARATKVLLTVLLVGIVEQIATQSEPRILTGILLVANTALWIFLLIQARKTPISAPFLLVSLLLTVTACVALVPGSSKDVNSYASYGRMVSEHQASPYSNAPEDFPEDVWSDRVSDFWADSPSVYGPLFTGISAAVMTEAGTSFTAARLAFQSISAIAYVAILAMLWSLTRRQEVLLFFGANPLVLAFGVNDAHCDLLVGAALLAAASLVPRERWLLVGCFLAAGVLVKISAAPAIAGAVAWIWFRFGRRPAVTVAVTAGALAGAALIAAGWQDVLAALGVAAERHTRFSFWAPLHGLLNSRTSLEYETVGQIVSLSASASIAVVGLYFIWKFRKEPIVALSMASGMVAYQVLGAYTLSWYVLWTLPLLALARSNAVATLAVAHATWVAVAYFSGYLGIALGAAIVAYVIVRARRSNPLTLPLFDKPITESSKWT